MSGASSLKTVFLALAFLAVDVHAAEDISKINGAIETEAGKAYGKLETVNGGIRIGARSHTDDAETVNGGITVADEAQTGALETVNGSIRLGRGVIVEGGVQTVNGSIFIDRGSRISEGVETVNGAIGLVGTQLGEGIETVNGDVTVGIDSQVQGGLHVIRPKMNLSLRPSRKPRIIIGPHAVVAGPLVFDREVDLYVHATAKTGPIRGATAQAYSGDTAP